MNKQKNKLQKLIRYCYKNTEKAGVLINLLHEKFMEENTACITLEILYTYIANIKKLIVKIQDEIQ